MRQFEANCTDSSITYWPSYEAGKIGVIALSLLEVTLIADLLWALADKITVETRFGIIATVLISAAFYFLLCRFLIRRKYDQYVVSYVGIQYSNKYTKDIRQINWEDVSAVCFAQDRWFGRKSCRIHINKSFSADRPCDFILPVHSVNEQNLLQFIPDSLRKNNPYNEWIM